ncbi:hypothetical protein MOQ72_02015 [Saccharopolyspora sp. K220]|uniref:hypothetical protein n=1 Tax=Saccharopolyspora soli TaxID=2926618 RepID=UPI001F59EB7F|nr:hypothetical protein [Saccharopolyspora soli]MCI2416186.1 hypothetical protein [Saccharopolyspora soli]
MTWFLHGTGQRTGSDWPMLQSFAADWEASWADVAGFHLEPMPEQQPVTTHLWAWSQSHWLRVRIDGACWWAALLSSDDSGVGEPWTETDEVPEPTISDIRHWHVGSDRQVRQFRGNTEILDRDDFFQLVPLRPTTAAFIGRHA